MKNSVQDASSLAFTRSAAHRRFVAGLLALSLGAHLSAASAQFKLQQTFAGPTAPGWTISGDALLTVPSVDTTGQGWLRLTGSGTNEHGLALSTQSFAANVPVTIRFSYVSWGGTGADGTSLFLFDSTQNMAGASSGGGLGYCNGAGGYLAIGLDEYGNFSSPFDHCLTGGTTQTPEALVVRGPLSAGNEYVTGVPVTGGIDNPGVTARPSPKTVIVTLTPATTGYTVTALFQAASGDPFQTLFTNVAFPYVAPANLSIGFSASTGGVTNNHEVQNLVVATPEDLQVAMSGPATVLVGAPVSYTLTVTNNGAYLIGAPDAPTVTDILPAAITGVSWTCTASAGASCTASGTGNLNTSGLTLPSNASVTYTITGTVASATCGSTVANTASADFGSASTFVDPNPANNSASASSTVTCGATLVANPSTLSFGTQTVGIPSAAHAITVTGTNSALISNIATTGNFSQTNDCSAALNGSSCTIQVVFTPASEGNLSGTLTITSSSASSPTTVTLSGTGTNATPNPFSFVPLSNVDPGTTQESMPITVAGTNAPTTISVSAGGEYSINGGPYTSAAGVVAPGAEVTMRLTASKSYATEVSAVLTIGGVNAVFKVTTRAQPQLQNVSVTSGGSGSVSPAFAIALALIVLLRFVRVRAVAVMMLVTVTAGLIARPATAADAPDITGHVYFGGTVGEVHSTLTSSKVTSRLRADGYQVVATDVKRNSLSGSVYAGVQLPMNFALEFGWNYLGRTRTQLAGVAPDSLQSLLSDVSRVTRGSGDAYSIVARYSFVLGPRLSLDLRAGPYRWVTHSNLLIGPNQTVNDNDRGWGYVVGLAPRYAITDRLSVGLGARYFASTVDSRFIQVGASTEYILR